MIKKLVMFCIVIALAGCAQNQMQSKDTDTDDDLRAMPAAGMLQPARDAGYLDATDPEAFPPTY